MARNVIPRIATIILALEAIAATPALANEAHGSLNTNGGGVILDSLGKERGYGVIGQSVVGMMRSESLVIEVGAVFVMDSAQTPVGRGDLDDDGDVDLADFLILIAGFSGPGMSTAHLTTDLDGDGDTDLADIIVFQVSFTGSR